jgi:HAMP domain-containing protein
MTAMPPNLPMMVNPIHIRGQIQMLEKQRNIAMNECAMAAGEIELLKAEVETLRQQLQKASCEKPTPPSSSAGSET